MIVPAADFGADGWIHARMALFRAVEDGFAMIRAARNGVVMIINDRGQVLARVNSTADGSSHVIADVSVGSGATIYRRFGDWFAWLSAATCLAIIGLLRKLRSQPDHRFS